MYRGHSERLIPSIQNPNSPNPFALWRPPLRRFPLICYSVYLWSGNCLLSSVLFWFRWIFLRGIRPIMVFEWYVCRDWFALMASWLLVCTYSFKYEISSDAHNCVSPPLISTLVHGQMLRTLSLWSELGVQKPTSTTDGGSTTLSSRFKITLSSRGTRPRIRLSGSLRLWVLFVSVRYKEDGIFTAALAWLYSIRFSMEKQQAYWNSGPEIKGHYLYDRAGSWTWGRSWTDEICGQEEWTTIKVHECTVMKSLGRV